MSRKKRVLCTGAAGTLGTAFWYALESKYDLCGLDIFSYAAFKDSRAQENNYGVGRIYAGDVRNYNDIAQILEYDGPFDAILHLACETHNDRSISGPSIFYETNVIGTQKVLEAAKNFKVPHTYVISTDEVLEHRPPANSDEDRGCYIGHWREFKDGLYFYRVGEVCLSNTSYHPTSPYSSSKACQEMVVNAYRQTYKLPVTIIRPTNFFGPSYPEKLIGKGITDLLKGENIKLYGQGLEWRDHCHVSDTVTALDLIIDQESPKDLYHCAPNREIQNKDVAKLILDVMGLSYDRLELIPDPRPFHDKSYSLNCNNLKRLGWSPKVSLREGIEMTVEFYTCV